MNLSRPTGERMAFTRRGPVVAAVGAYPFGLIVEQAASAVAAGCPVVAKPAFKTPLSCLAFLDFLDEAVLPTEQGAATDGETVTGTLAAGTGFFPSSARRTPDGACAANSLPARVVHGACAASSLPARVVRSATAAPLPSSWPATSARREAFLPGCFGNAGQSGVSVRRVFDHTRIVTRCATQLSMKASGLLVGDAGRFPHGAARPSGRDGARA